MRWWSRALLRLLIDSRDIEDIEGDLDELYREKRLEVSRLRASLYYCYELSLLVLNFLLKPDKPYYKRFNRIAMFKSYLTITLRVLKRKLAYTTLNVTGLAVGITCCVLMLLFINDELSYDRMHTKADRIYRLYRNSILGDNSFRVANTAAAMGPMIQTDFAAVEHMTRLFPIRSELMLEYGDQKFFEKRFFFADSTLFDVFDFKLKSGNPQTVLKSPYSLVMTESSVLKYFGNEDPVGKVLKLEGQIDFTVTGVLEDVPKNSHIKFDMFASLADYKRLAPGYFSEVGQWFNNGFYTYMVLNESADIKQLESRLPAFVDKYMGPSFSQVTSGDYQIELKLEKFTDIYLKSDLLSQLSPVSDIRYVYIFSIVAGFVLIIACINFVNLSTAKSSARAKEVGIRKVMGAFRGQVMRQFLTESMVMAFLALLLALGFIYLVLPAFNGLAEKELTFALLLTWPLWPALLIGVALIGLLSGIYPAFLISGFQPLKALNSTRNAGRQVRPVLRKVLVLFQFVISVALIVATLVVSRQLAYLQEKELGYNQEQLLVFPLTSKVISSFEAFKAELKKSPLITGATGASGFPGQRIAADSYPVYPEGKVGEDWVLRTTIVDYDFLETMGIELVLGRDFDSQKPSDESSAFIINEAAMKALSWDDPLGKRLVWEQGAGADKEGTIIGVVKDYHYQSLHETIEPLVLHVDKTWMRSAAVRIAPGNVQLALQAVETAWKAFEPDKPVGFSFMDDTLNQKYAAEIKLGKIFNYFSAMAIVIACLGLLGLISFIVNHRLREVAIRKVLGASGKRMVFFLSREFLMLVGLAVLVAWPLAFMLMRNWLNTFAYQEDLGAGPFLLAGFIAFAITGLTVGYHAIRASLANPVKTLRCE